MSNMEWTRGPTIGLGSTSTVSLATSLSSGELFAVKSTELSNSGSLQREQKFLSKLNSPYIIKYMGFNVTKEDNVPMYNLCLEYVSGGTLRDEINRQGGQLEESEIRSYTRDILKGLDYLHTNIGLAHCDIKSQNVLVTHGRSKIADLGCARLVHEVSSTSSFSGTPAFMAPEVARGEDQGFQADIWALGCTIIEMATGKHPWEEFNDPLSALYRIGFSGYVPELPRCLSEKGKDFLSKCLRREAEERWTTRELLDHPFVGGVDLEGKEVDEKLDMSSPSCVLDQGFWDTMEPLESPQDLGCLDSANERINRLIGSGFSFNLEVSNWHLEEDWVTVRSCNAEEINRCHEENGSILEDEALVNTRFLLTAGSIIYEQEQDHSSVFNEDSLFGFPVEDVSSSFSSSISSTRIRDNWASGLDDCMPDMNNSETHNANSISFSSILVSFRFSGCFRISKKSKLMHQLSLCLGEPRNSSEFQQITFFFLLLFYIEFICTRNKVKYKKK